MSKKRFKEFIIKNLVYIFIISLFIQVTFSKNTDDPDRIELIIENQSGSTIYVQVFPVSMIFNGYNVITYNGHEYSLLSTFRQSTNNGYWYDYNSGSDMDANNNLPRTFFEVFNNGNVTLNWDEAGAGGCLASFGYGIYKVQFYSSKSLIEAIDSVLFEQDFEPIGDNIIVYHGLHDLEFDLQCYEQPINIRYDNDMYYFIRKWLFCGGTKSYGDFHLKTNYPWGNIFPLDCRRDCYVSQNIEQNHSFPGLWGYSEAYNDVRQGNLMLNMTLDKSVATPSNLKSTNEGYTFTNQISITEYASLNLPNNIIITLTGLPYDQNFIMTNKTLSTINLGENAGINIGNNTKLILECHSILNCSTNPNAPSRINIAGDGEYCDLGVIKSGYLRIGYISYSVNTIGPCTRCYNDSRLFQDSTIVALDSGAIVNVPSNVTLNFDGIDSKLEMYPNSVLKMGQNSKLVFQNGARLISKNASMISSDVNTTWDGIYLSGNSHDTIIGCTIQNATNGINISDKYSAGFVQPTTEISDCAFIDSSSSQITSGITVSNSNNVLLKHNTFSSVSVLEGFLNAILVENCPSGNLDILDNTINNVTNGITSIQSSPYIARNSITGQIGDGIGIYIDNSNGTIKYNNVQNFQKSYVSYYSSPYLYRNTFNGAGDRNMDLYQNSIPVMNVLNSASVVMNLGGNNVISGTPSTCGIYINDNSIPAIDSGFNNITVSNSNYLVCNDLQSQTLDVSYNYWYDRPPNSMKFVVSNGIVVDTPDYDGVTLTKPTTYNLYNIGFELYDSVYYISLGGNSPGGNLFEQAYTNELSGQYSNAISGYKQVVSDYTNSELAPAAISRIINCLEKKPGTATDYLDLQSYMQQILGRSTLPHAVKELAEDFIIKTKVNLWRVEQQQNQILNAINNYDTMYQHNIGNSKGTHALVDKLSLISIYNDTSQNHLNAFNNSNQKKFSLLYAILGKNFSVLHVSPKDEGPKEFMLYQNFPNPFNPITKIKYDVPKEGFITIKIFDLIGREIYSANEYRLPGRYEMSFNGSNYASGVYFYRIEAGGFVAVKKMVLIK